MSGIHLIPMPNPSEKSKQGEKKTGLNISRHAMLYKGACKPLKDEVDQSQVKQTGGAVGR